MHTQSIALVMFCAIVLAFFAAAYFACVSWPKMGLKGRMAAPLLLAPHFLLIACIIVSLLNGHPAPGSSGFNTQFVCGVLILFILPLPALAGTLAALVIFTRARSGS
ncbi:MAG TPA: hypothetical protein VHX36_06810 [Candidatus Acidoferrales bacterium]|jgi:H+/Cl- antiporter ClcA|nr:hypothetical protein [Candidatus Acidoferrales bacterium]